MRACVRNGHVIFSEWIEVAQGLRQRYVLRVSPLLFDSFFAGVLLIALQRFNEDADILADLVHLKRSDMRRGSALKQH